MMKISLCLNRYVIVFSENIVAIGDDDEIAQKYDETNIDERIDATGCCILPGFLDAHTHPIWAGDRVHEYAKKVLSLMFYFSCFYIFNDRFSFS